ncbi:MAG: GGDEF domain-containing protein [Clostridium sp.]|uniref:GGDEF domain-containing protein n=1 Tax=Clostridium sp. TaxID=1506 RepID=UPI002FCBF70D
MKKFNITKIIIGLTLVTIIIFSTGFTIIYRFNNNTATMVNRSRGDIRGLIYIENYDNAIKVAKNTFNSIPKFQYNSQYTNIHNMLSEFKGIPKGEELAIDILTTIEGSQYITDNTRLKATRSLKNIYLNVEDYAKSTKYTLKTMYLAKKCNNKYLEIKSEIELGVDYSYIKGENTAIKLIEETLNKNVDNKKEDTFLKVYAYVNLAELYYDKGNYDKSLECINSIPSYKEHFNEEDARDIEIIKLLLACRNYIAKNNLQSAQNNLDRADKLIKVDKDVFLTGKNQIYLVARGEYFYAINKYKDALENNDYGIQESHNNRGYKYCRQFIKNNIKVADAIEDNTLRIKYYRELIKSQEVEDRKIYSNYAYFIIENVKFEDQLTMSFKRLKLSNIIILFTVVIIAIGIPIGYKILTNARNKILRDGLTGIYNRYYLNKEITKLVKKHKNFSIIMYDLDNFKKINDTYGHDFGDIVLINTSKVVNNRLSPNEALYRYGGEEFVVIVKDAVEERVRELAEIIRSSIESMEWRENITTTVSIGVAHSKINGENTIKIADDNLYKAKQSGKNRVVD